MLDAAFKAKGLTESFTLEQRVEVNGFLEKLVDHCLEAINDREPSISAMDTRPDKVWTDAEPNVRLRYVQQGMLEDLIAMLQVHV